MPRLIPALMALVLAAPLLYAQPTTVNTPPCNEGWCLQNSYKYKFCNAQGNLVEKCSFNPNNEPGLIPFKMALPQGLCDDFTVTDGIERIGIVADGDPVSLVVGDGGLAAEFFNNEDLHADLLGAQLQWESLCPHEGPNDEYQYCCIKVNWTTNPVDMGRSPDAEATTWIYTHDDTPLNPHDCRRDCDKSRIYLNRTERHIDVDENGVPQHFLFTIPLDLKQLPSKYSYAYAYSVFLHELGHWYGFGHSDDPDSYQNTCVHPTSIMHTGTSTNWDHVTTRDLTDDDICMFKKLYCCESSAKAGVEEERENNRRFSFEVRPNPATTKVHVLFGDAGYHEEAQLRIVSSNGHVIKEQSIPRDALEISMDVSSFAPDAYIFEVIRPGFVFSRKVMIAR